MSSKVKNRSRKPPAVVEIEKTQEDVIGSTSDPVALKLAASEKVSKKKLPPKRKAAAVKVIADAVVEPEEEVSEEEVQPAPLKRGRAPKAAPAEKVPVKEVSAPAKRGRKAKETNVPEPEKISAKQTVEKPKENGTGKKQIDELATTKKGRGRQKLVEPVEKSSPVTTVESVEPEQEDEEEVVEERKKNRGRGRPAATKKEAPKENGTNKTAEKAKKTVEPAVKKGGRKRKNADEPEENIGHDEDHIEPKKVRGRKAAAKSEAQPKKAVAKKINNTETSYETQNFKIDKKFNLKITTWNVGGLRAWLNKNGTEIINYEKPDILCLQEIKCSPDKMPEEAKISGYHPYWLCGPNGYAGVALYSKIMPINVEYGIGDPEQDADGRILTAEYEKFFLICVYVPNSGRKLVTLPKRLRWNELFDSYVEKLNAKKPVIIAGDMNVSHQEIDLANPKANKRNAGFTQEERDGLTKLLSLGYIDTFRYFYPDRENAYTYWTYMANARARNVGWRLDYFIVSDRLINKTVDNVIRSDVLGSDHCPVTLFLIL